MWKPPDDIQLLDPGGEPGVTRRASPLGVIFPAKATLTTYTSESVNTNVLNMADVGIHFFIFREVLTIQKLGP